MGISEVMKANPIQAAFASGAAFISGGLVPLLVTLFFPIQNMEFTLYGFSILFLILLGIISAKTGGAKVWKAIVRVVFWGTLAMGVTAFVGYLFGVNI